MGRTRSWPSAEAAGLDPAPLEAMRQDLRAAVEAAGLPGYVVGVSKDGRTAFVDAHGLRDISRPDSEVGVETLFRLYSMTKAIVSVALMTFYDQGLVALDDPVSKFLGERWDPPAAGAAPGTRGLWVAASDGVVRGAAGESSKEQAIGASDTAFLFAKSVSAHVDVDPRGAARCRWNDCGPWQAVRLEPLPTPGYAAIRAHTGRYLDIVDGAVVASSQSQVAWLLRASGSQNFDEEPDVFVAGARVRLKHQATGLWVQLGIEDGRPLRTVPEVSEATVFSFEKQTWRIPSLEPARCSVTVRHLLTHTSGLDYAGQEPRLVTALDALVRPLVQRCELNEVTSLEQWVEEISKMPLRCQPGSRFMYGTSIDVLGRILEILGEAPLHTVLHDRVLAPLGMTSTGFAVRPEDAAARLAVLYRVSEDASVKELEVLDDPRGERGSHWVPPVGPAPILAGGGGVETIRGGLVGTLPDYMRFCHMLLFKGELNGERVLKASTVELMTEVNHLEIVLGKPGATMSASEPQGWGLLGSIELPKDKETADHPGTYGWGGWAATIFRVFPKDGVVVVLMTNCVDPDNRLRKLSLARVGESIRGGHARRVPLWQRLWPGPRPTAWRRSSVAAAAGVAAALLSALAVAAAARRRRALPPPALRGP